MEIYSAFNIKVNNTNREAGRFPYFFCANLFALDISNTGKFTVNPNNGDCVTRNKD